MATVIFLCRHEDLDRERWGYARAFERQGITVITCAPTPGVSFDLRTYVEALPSRPLLVLHPDVGSVLPDGLMDVDVPTVCFHIDGFVNVRRRIQLSMLFDYACVFHRELEPLWRAAGHSRFLFVPHAVDPISSHRGVTRASMMWGGSGDLTVRCTMVGGKSFLR